MSAAKGVDYLNRHLQEHLNNDPKSLLENPEASVVGNLLDRFEKHGMKGWEKQTPEYFLTYLFTEIGITPHNMKDGRNCISMMTALQIAIQDLKTRRYDEWHPKETVKLVHEYLMCADELKMLNLLFSKRMAFFKGLEKDVMIQNSEDSHGPLSTDNEGCETALERIQWAINNLERDVKNTELLLADLLQAMNSVRLSVIQRSARELPRLTCHFSYSKYGPSNRTSSQSRPIARTKRLSYSPVSPWSFSRFHSLPRTTV